MCLARGGRRKEKKRKEKLAYPGAAAVVAGEKRLRVAYNVIVFPARIGNGSWLLRLLPVVVGPWHGVA